ncbi:protein FAM151B-like [Eriocheir sinensis]|uniref:protein FAM151B-like n=1 Tax=Eriocheir sinensis TaxID=95602 RepID=UPI0021C90048|nr:protein FAM151B-like [Eriocheir sinensis]
MVGGSSLVLLIIFSGVVMSAETGEQAPVPDPPTEETEAMDGLGPIDAADFFPEVRDDLTEVTWAHRVNSQAELEAMLKDDKIMMLEADVLSGKLRDSEEKAKEGEREGESSTSPIMAHPPEKESDLTVAMWLDQVIQANQGGKRKGIKLDFKELSVVKESLEELVKRKEEMTFPIWLNADILPGPSSRNTPVPSTDFLTTCAELFPQATLSLGWTTFVAPNSPAVESGYSREHFEAMVQALDTHAITQPVTFPIRAAFVPHSIENLEWLLENTPDSTVTIWSSPQDPFDPEAIKTLVDILGHNAVYLDLPETQMTQYRDVAAAAAAAEGASKGAPFCLLPTSASAWASVGMALATALAALYLYE